MALSAQNASNIAPFEGDQRNLPAFRSPPHNFEAEKALLGAILANNNAFDRVTDFLKSEHFADPVHGRIYDALARLILRNQIADPVTLRMFFEQDGTLTDVGGARYLGELAASMVSIINVGDYGRLIYDLFIKRQLIDLGEQVVNRAYEPEVEAEEQISAAEAHLYELAEHGQMENGFKGFNLAVTEAINIAGAAHKRDGRLAGVGTGFRDIDEMLGGLHPSDLIILAGRPSMGKTALATNIAYNAAANYKIEKNANGEDEVASGGVVGFFSLEMSSDQLAARILSEQSNIPSDAMRRGKLTNEEFERLTACATNLYKLPLYIDDTPGMSISMLRTRAKRLKREKGLGLVIVDYLQLMTGTNRTDNRVQEISEITRGLKTLAKELRIPVIALSQLSRQVENREDKRPQLADLRESGTIEQDADVVAFIYREAYYMERAEPQQRPDESPDKFAERAERWQSRIDEVRHVADFIMAKQRHGPTGTISLYFDGMYTRFGDLDTQHTDRQHD